MYSDHRGRSPGRDRDRDRRYDVHPSQHDQGERERAHDYNDRPHHEGHYNRSRHDYSRSPAAPLAGRNELNYDDVPDEDPHSVRRQYGGEEEHYGGGRRREYDGTRTSPHGASHIERDGRPGRRHDEYGHSRRDYHRRRSESYSDGERGGGRRGRSHSPGEHRHPGPPSDTVILEGLPTDIPVNELQSTLLSSAVLAPLNLIDIRIPPSGGNRRAFMQFRSVDEAVQFVDDNFPEIYVDMPDIRQATSGGQTCLYLHFARSRDDDRRAPPTDQWTCPSCDFSNYSTRTRCKSCGYAQGSSMSYRPLLTGETDASNDASHFLVIYPLDAQVTEEVLEFGVKKLEIVEKQQPRDGERNSKPLKSTAPTGDTTGYGARRGSLHRVFLMRDKSTNQSLKFGFAEFWTLEDAVAALTKFRLSKNFTIGGTPVTISGIHMGVFVPEQREVQPGTEKFSFVPIFNPAVRVKYWDPHAYPNPRVINADAPSASDADSGQKGAEEKKSKKRRADSSLGSSTAKKPVAMAPQMAMWQKKHHEIHGDKAQADANGSETNGSDTEARRSTPKPEKQGPIKISLGGMAKVVATPAPPSATGSTSPGSTANDGPASGQPTPSTPPVSYVDRDRVCCLICMMKYKSLDDLDIHERSGNHKKVMGDEEKVKAALPRLAARDKRMEQARKDQPGSSQYRDRAKERREAFSQPKKPSAQQAPGKPARQKSEPKEPEPQKPKESKGSAMLAKMGWTSGKGLGANGEGRTDIVETSAYQEGVGLGVEGGNLGDAAKLAERKTKGDYGAYVNEAQEKARERYSRLG